MKTPTFPPPKHTHLAPRRAETLPQHQMLLLGCLTLQSAQGISLPQTSLPAPEVYPDLSHSIPWQCAAFLNTMVGAWHAAANLVCQLRGPILTFQQVVLKFTPASFRCHLQCLSQHCHCPNPPSEPWLSLLFAGRRLQFLGRSTMLKELQFPWEWQGEMRSE